MIINACTECKESDTKLTNETKEWFDYYQKNEYSVFANNDSIDTLLIINKYPSYDLEVDFPVDNCSSNGDCFCEIRSYNIKSDKILFNIYGRDNNIIRITIGESKINIYIDKKIIESNSCYGGELIKFEYQGLLYETIELKCTDNQTNIKGIIISKELGVLEYEDQLGNVWVKR